jgi:hypothetical protein
MIYLVWTLYIVLQILVILVPYIAIMSIIIFIDEPVKRYYGNRKRIRLIKIADKNWEEYLQQKRRIELQRKLRRKEREMYPLFYWKENI